MTINNPTAPLAPLRATNFALQNGTPTILATTTPNDGNKHLILVAGWVQTTSAETGGVVVLNYFANGVGQSQQIDAGGHGAGLALLQGAAPSLSGFLADPNTPISIVQSTALTVGAATLSAALLII